jgi:hypothetical protein
VVALETQMESHSSLQRNHVDQVCGRPRPLICEVRDFCGKAFDNTTSFMVRRQGQSEKERSNEPDVCGAPRAILTNE